MAYQKSVYLSPGHPQFFGDRISSAYSDTSSRPRASSSFENQPVALVAGYAASGGALGKASVLVSLRPQVKLGSRKFNCWDSVNSV